MAIVKNLAFCSKDILKKMNFANNGALASNFVPFPFDLIHSLLPLGLKFLGETYVVMDKGKVYGLITLEKDYSNKKRLKITRFFLEENSGALGELLINYVVNRYMAQGAESFYIAVDEEDAKLINLLCDVCKFRSAGEEYLFKVKKSDFPYQKNDYFGFIRFSKNSEISQISELYNGMISSWLLPVFQMEAKQFRDNVFVGFTNKVMFKYVLSDDDKNQIFGYFTISTVNNKDFILDVVLSLGFEVYLADILRFTRSEISKRKNGWTLYVRVKSCFSNHKEFLNTMKSFNVNYSKKSKVLVKDLYRAQKSESLINGKQIIFNDITPAY